MVGIGCDFRVVRSVIVPEYATVLTDIGVGIMHTHRVSQFRADSFVDVQIGTIPEKYPATN
jgi:hypothetical protein